MVEALEFIRVLAYISGVLVLNAFAFQFCFGVSLNVVKMK